MYTDWVRDKASPFARILKLIGETQKIRFRQSGEREGIPAKVRVKYESTYTASAFRVYLYDFDVHIQLRNNDR